MYVNEVLSLSEEGRIIPNLLKVTIVESKEILVLIIQALDVVRDTLGEVPDVSSLEDVGSESPILIYTSEEKRAVVNETPFSLAINSC